MDFDGTLTDNNVLVIEDGREAVIASRGDGLGLELLRKHTDVQALILSKEVNKVVNARAQKLKIPCLHGLQNKIDDFKKEVSERGLKFEEVCFVGNDLNDIECIKAAGVGIAVQDSYSQVLSVADYITSLPGGKGAVREVCELILYAKDAHPFGWGFHDSDAALWWQSYKLRLPASMDK